jgi:hypothetical protein
MFWRYFYASHGICGDISESVQVGNVKIIIGVGVEPVSYAQHFFCQS